MRKKYGTCEHDEVNYKTLNNFCKQLFRRIRSDKKTFKILSEDIKYKNKQIQQLQKFNETAIDRYEDTLEEFEKANESLKKANTQLVLDVEDLKQRLFGHYERRLKDFALRPDRKKDN